MDKYPYEVQQKLREILEQTDKVAWMFSKEPTKDDLACRRYVDALIQPRRQVDEIGAFIAMIDRFPFDKRVIFADRGYESYNVLAHIAQRNMHYLIRVKQPMSSGIIRGMKLPQNTVHRQRPLERGRGRAGSEDVRLHMTFKGV